jgi:hypothetical protein
MNRLLGFVVLAGLALTLCAAPAKADSSDVTLNTSTLTGTQIVVFEFTDGDGLIDNSLTLSSFNFGGGSAVGLPDYGGTTGVSGNLTSGISMDDSSGFLALFVQDFNPGTSLSFLLNTTDNFAGGSPDVFAMSVCDLSFNCYSDDMNTGALLVLSLNGGTLSPSDFTLNGASAQGLPAPTVGGAAGVPEPGSLLLLASGLLALGGSLKIRRRMESSPR